MDDQILLYVEDEDASAFLLETALEGSDLRLQIRRVVDGEEALSFLKQTGDYSEAPRPDLVLLDLNLPRKSGFEVLSELRCHESLSSLPVVIFSSSALPTDKRRALALGALGFITKPRSFEGLVEAMKEACSYCPPRVG
jgi:two-component system, chemotaxis family, response regulator Rcp1